MKSVTDIFSNDQEAPKPLDPISIVYVPPKIDLGDLQDNNKLLTEDQIKAIQSAQLSDGRHKKSELSQKLKLEIPFDVANVNGQYFAIYKGKKHRKDLGSGTFGTVKLAQDLKTGDWVALKVIKKSSLNDEYEVQALEDTRQKIGLYERSKHTEEGEKQQTELFMTLAQGTRLGALGESGRDIPAIKYMDVFINLLHATQELHKAGIVHRDIKPDNIIFDIVNDEVKLIDFGLARKMEDCVYASSSYAGTKYYMAPEILPNRKLTDTKNYYSEKTDLYALAASMGDILGYEIDRKSNTFRLALSEDILDEQGGLSRPKILNPFVEAQVLALLNQMISVDPKQRPTMDEVIKGFNDIRSQHLDTFSKIVKVGYVDIDEYITATPQEKRAMLKVLSSVDQICLVDQHGKNQDQYVAIKQGLENAGFNVASSVVQYRDRNIDLAQALSEYAEKQPQKDSRVYLNYFVANKSDSLTPDAQKQMNAQAIVPVFSGKQAINKKSMKMGMGLPIEPQKLKKIYKLLIKEHARLTKKEASDSRTARAELMQKAISDLEPLVTNGKTIQYATLYNKLNQLEKNMQQYDTHMSVFGRKFHMSTKTRSATLSIMQTLNKGVDAAVRDELKKKAPSIPEQVKQPEIEKSKSKNDPEIETKRERVRGRKF